MTSSNQTSEQQMHDTRTPKQIFAIGQDGGIGASLGAAPPGKGKAISLQAALNQAGPTYLQLQSNPDGWYELIIRSSNAADIHAMISHAANIGSPSGYRWLGGFPNWELYLWFEQSKALKSAILFAAFRDFNWHFPTGSNEEDSSAKFREGWTAAVAWLRRHGDAHAGKWAGMEPREAIKAAAEEMEKVNG